MHSRDALRSSHLAAVHKHLKLRIASIVIARDAQAERPGLRNRGWGRRAAAGRPGRGVKCDGPISSHDRGMRVQAVISVRGGIAGRIGSRDHLRTHRDAADVQIAVMPLTASPVPGIVDEPHFDMVRGRGIEISGNRNILPLAVGVHSRDALRSSHLAAIHKHLKLRIADVMVAGHV